MERKTVSSSNLISVGYEEGVLEIMFYNKRVYRYFSVPENIYTGLITASSKGAFHAKFIKGRFLFEQIY